MGAVTDGVLELADLYRVSERTAWRWVEIARNGGELPPLEPTCEFCGEPIDDRRNRSRRFCDATCRVMNHYAARGR